MGFVGGGGACAIGTGHAKAGLGTIARTDKAGFISQITLRRSWFHYVNYYWLHSATSVGTVKHAHASKPRPRPALSALPWPTHRTNTCTRIRAMAAMAMPLSCATSASERGRPFGLQQTLKEHTISAKQPPCSLCTAARRTLRR